VQHGAAWSGQLVVRGVLGVLSRFDKAFDAKSAKHEMALIVNRPTFIIAKLLVSGSARAENAEFELAHCGLSSDRHGSPRDVASAIGSGQRWRRPLTAAAAATHFPRSMREYWQRSMRSLHEVPTIDPPTCC
jgi:hypothetical protein